MAKKTGSFRSQTRHKLRKKPRMSGKVNINKILGEFKVGERVRILHEPAIQAGMPHPRFKNFVGTIIQKKGKAYVLEIKDGGKRKEIISAAIHLNRL